MHRDHYALVANHVHGCIYSAKMEASTEEKLISVLTEYYASHSSECGPLAYLKRSYGRGFKFSNFGLGAYGKWMQANEHLFKPEKTICKLLDEVDTANTTEEQLLETVVLYFTKSEMFFHRRHALDHIRKVYGCRPFGDYGYGTFKQFIARHGLDMGIAKRSDFKTVKEWNSWQGRTTV